METKLSVPTKKLVPSVGAKACSLLEHYKEWTNITLDKQVLDAIKGFEIPFKSIPFQTAEPVTPNYTEADEILIDESVKKLLKTGAIVKSENEIGQFISTVFTVPKPDQTRRPILNLKKVNFFVDSPHFKMETIKTATNLVSPDYFMVVIDLKDAYHAISIGMNSQKYLKFRWRGQLYKYKCLPFGLSIAPFLYTKITKPIVAKLRAQGIVLVAYLDDTLIIGRDYNECLKFRDIALSLFRKLGFTINRDKSQLIPSQMVRYLGFEINSSTMRLILPEEKRQRIVTKCQAAIKSKNMSIQNVAELVGTLIAAVPAIKYGLLYTRQLEIEKIAALAINNSNYSAKMEISKVPKNYKLVSFDVVSRSPRYPYKKPLIT